MKEIELCMKYDTCRRCPRNRLCELEQKQQEKEKHKNEVKQKTK